MSVAFVKGIHKWPVDSTHIWPVTRKMFPFDDVIMFNLNWLNADQDVLSLLDADQDVLCLY